MRKLLPVFVLLGVFLAVASGTLWRELRSERQLVADLRAQMAQMQTAQMAQMSPVEPELPQTQAQAQALAQALAAAQAQSALCEATKAPVSVARILAPTVAPATVEPKSALATSLPELVLPGDASEEARRTAALQQADQTATARVRAWVTRLSSAGMTVTPGQVEALNAAMITELRRETDDSLGIDNRNGPVDPETALRIKEETINRQNETNLRVLDAVTNQLTVDQVTALRTQFEAGHASRLAALREEREQAASGGN